MRFQAAVDFIVAFRIEKKHVIETNTHLKFSYNITRNSVTNDKRNV